MYGYEMTWSGSTGGWGHINTFNTPGFETRKNSDMNLKNYYNTISSLPQDMPHQVPPQIFQILPASHIFPIFLTNVP